MQVFWTNIALSNGKIQIKPEKRLVPIAENYPELQKRYTMLESEKGHHNKGNAKAFSGYSFGLGWPEKIRTKIIIFKSTTHKYRVDL